MATLSFDLNNQVASSPAMISPWGPSSSGSFQMVLSQILQPIIHDLKMPLSAEKRALELVKKGLGNIPGDIQALLTGMQKNNQDLISLVEQLMEMANGLTPSASFSGKWIRLRPLVEDACLQLAPLAEAKGIRVESDLPLDLPSIWMYPPHLQRVLINLLGNAIQHTPCGTIVQIMAEVQHEFVSVRIRDNGCLSSGHPMAEEPLFVQNSGLGLSICRTLLEMNGGKIRLDSRYKEGLCFLLSLPCAVLEERMACKS